MFIHSRLTFFLISFSIDGSYKPNRKNIPKFILISKRQITRLFENICLKLTSTHVTLIVMWRRSGPLLRNPSE